MPLAIPNTKVISYADDTSLIFKCPKPYFSLDQLENTLTILEKWFSFNGLKINFSKSKIIPFEISKRTPISFNTYTSKTNYTLPQTSKKENFLGITIDFHLNWKSHIAELIVKLNKACYALFILSKFVSKHILKIVYFAYFHSKLSYGIEIWGNSIDSKKVFILQKKVIRMICDVKKTAHCKNLFQKLEVLPLPCLFIYQTLVYTKIHLTSYYSTKINHTHNTRNTVEPLKLDSRKLDIP